ncbi:uncharacterized protein RAG0_10454 [Rhynchosporium agropyri]|uniref:Uncharacterized protein n=1 Tax=Rhynchosporium agropyri TaxID=914238 RepID=A0A1E1KZY8_9HELO|nr:uncharacterized protein RAG0_10454 [Rhynchosporium agropyri]
MISSGILGVISQFDYQTSTSVNTSSPIVINENYVVKAPLKYSKLRKENFHLGSSEVRKISAFQLICFVANGTSLGSFSESSLPAADYLHLVKDCGSEKCIRVYSTKREVGLILVGNIAP